MPKRNVWRIYILPYDDSGSYTDWVEVTRDVIADQLGQVSEQLDNSDFDIGIFKPGAFTLALKNQGGKYSDVDNVKSIFRFRRGNSQVKITWEIEPDGGPYSGLMVVGDTWLSEETEIFKGLINDDGTAQDIDTNEVRFQVIGRETLFKNVAVPSSGISNGDLYSEVIYAILNQSKITSLLTVDQANIVCQNDLTIDAVAALAGKTVLEALQQLLTASNSVFYIQDDTLYVSSRAESAAVLGNFYGQGSSSGPENIQSIKAVKGGVAKVFNFVTWSDTTLIIQDSESVLVYGVRKKELSIDFVTDNTKRQSIMQAIVDEYKDPRQEFELYSPLRYETVGLKLLDKVSIDYPVVHVPNENPAAICGQAICGDCWTPKALWDFQVDSTDYYKILSRSVDAKGGIVKFRVRAI